MRQGNIDSPPKTPLVPGFECSGIVEAMGENTKGFEVSESRSQYVTDIMSWISSTTILISLCIFTSQNIDLCSGLKWLMLIF